jgi:hypothetical protein
MICCFDLLFHRLSLSASGLFGMNMEAPGWFQDSQGGVFYSFESVVGTLSGREIGHF